MVSSFSKLKRKQEIYEKFEKFLSKLVWRETLTICKDIGMCLKENY